MSVKPKKWFPRERKQDSPTVAADLLKEGHPKHNAFRKWCLGRDKEITRRQARKFLQLHPEFRNIEVDTKGS